MFTTQTRLWTPLVRKRHASRNRGAIIFPNRSEVAPSWQIDLSSLCKPKMITYGMKLKPPDSNVHKYASKKSWEAVLQDFPTRGTRSKPRPRPFCASKHPPALTLEGGGYTPTGPRRTETLRRSLRVWARGGGLPEAPTEGSFRPRGRGQGLARRVPAPLTCTRL